MLDKISFTANNKLSNYNLSDKVRNYSNLMKTDIPDSFTKAQKSSGISIPFTANRHPKVAIIDLQKSIECDINGDGIGDIFHGEMAKRIIEKSHPGTETEMLLASTFDDTINHLTTIADELDKGNKKYDAVCMPLAFFCNINDLKTQTGIDITPENIKDYKNELKQHFKTYVDPTGNKTYEKVFGVIQAIKRITQSKNNIPVFISGGNFPNNNINLYCLADGATNVGSLHADGSKKINNATHSLINKYAQGFFDVFEVKDEKDKVIGYDIFGDGSVFAKFDEVSKGVSKVKQFVGKHLNELLVKQTNEDDYERKRMKCLKPEETFSKFCLDGKLFDIEKIKQRMITLGVETVSFDTHEGDYMPFENSILFKTDENGQIYYDPSGTGRKDAIWSVAGTSYSAPKAVGEYLNQKFPENQ